MVHIAESTVGRRYAGWFIKNTERAQRNLDDLRNTPLPVPQLSSSQTKSSAELKATPQAKGAPRPAPKVAWGGVKVT